VVVANLIQLQFLILWRCCLFMQVLSFISRVVLRFELFILDRLAGVLHILVCPWIGFSCSLISVPSRSPWLGFESSGFSSARIV
jgi:hypothetical protein